MQCNYSIQNSIINYSLKIYKNYKNCEPFLDYFNLISSPQIFDLTALLPLTHKSADFMIKNDNLFPVFSAILLARCLWKIEHSGPIPPVIE